MAGELTSLSLAMGRGVVSGGVVPIPSNALLSKSGAVALTNKAGTLTLTKKAA